MKSSKFATAVFAFSGLVFLATAGHAAYQEVKPAPVSIQLTDEEKNWVLAYVSTNAKKQN